MLKKIIEQYPDQIFLKIDGHDNAVIGVDGTTMRLCYSVKQIVKNLMKDMSKNDAIEFYDYNIADAYVGEKTPILITDYFL